MRTNIKQNKYSYLRWLFIVIFVILSFTIIPKVKFDNSLERWIPTTSPKVNEYKNFLEQYSSDAVLLITIQKPTNLSNDEIHKILDKLKIKINQLPGVLRITNWPIPLIELKNRPNNDYFTLTVFFSSLSYLKPGNPELLSAIKAIVANIPFKTHLAGTGIIAQAINDETRRSTVMFSSYGLAILIILLFFVTKHPSHIILIVGISIGGVISLLFCAVLFSIPLTIISSILPVLILFYGTSNAIHLLFHNGNIRAILVPCLLTTLTTCCGFTVFLFDSIPLFKDFAILAIGGIIGGFIWTLVFFYQSQQEFMPHDFLQKLTKKWRLSTDILIPITVIIIFIVMIPGILNIKTDVYPLSILSTNNKSFIDHHIIEKHVGPYLPLEYTIELPKVDKTQVRQWMTGVMELKQVGGVLSYLHFPATMNVSRYGYLSKFKPIGRVTFMITNLSSREGISLVKEIEKISSKCFSNYTPKVTGYVTLYGIIAQNIGVSFVKSLLIALTLIFIIIFMYLRNFKLFIISLIPNLLPIIICIGLMGWFNINLDMVTVPIGCLLLSIIVDDTIHFLYWYRKTGNVNEAFKEAAPGIILTSTVLGCGFAVYFISSAPPLQYFGFLSVTALITALFCDLVLLPYLLKKYRDTNKIKNYIK